MPGTRKYSILIVDDIESIRFALSDFLGREHQVFSAANGIAALELLRQNQIDLVITDIRMPEMSGLELISIIKRDFPKTKYALMTAYNTNDYITLARQHSIWNIIPKTTLLNLNHIKIMAEKLISNDIFGLEKYFPDFNTEIITINQLNAIRKDNSLFCHNQLYELIVTEK